MQATGTGSRSDFVGQPDMPALMAQMAMHGCPVRPNGLTYFVGMEKIVARDDSHGMPHGVFMVFALLLRNGARVAGYLRTPADQAVDIGRQISI